MDKSAATILSERGPESPSQARVLWTKQQQEWMGILGQMVQHDFHHLPQYHRVEEYRLKGMAYLFTYCDGDYVIGRVLPLVRLRFHASR